MEEKKRHRDDLVPQRNEMGKRKHRERRYGPAHK